MSYSVLLAGCARRELANLPAEIVARIDQQIMSLGENPRPPGCKKLRTQTPMAWRVRVGKYRILYCIDDHKRQITLYRIGHRREVYD